MDTAATPVDDTDDEEDYALVQAARKAEALAVGAKCCCGQPAEFLVDATGGPCADYPLCGTYVLRMG